MDHTIAGAASGETMNSFMAPKGSQSQAKGQKSIKSSICYTYLFIITNRIYYFL